jgi:hypothetical protein
MRGLWYLYDRTTQGQLKTYVALHVAVAKVPVAEKKRVDGQPEEGWWESNRDVGRRRAFS